MTSHLAVFGSACRRLLSRGRRRSSPVVSKDPISSLNRPVPVEKIWLKFAREQIYFTDAFLGSGRTNFWAIRTRNDPANYGNVVSAAVKQVDPQVLVNEVQTGDCLIEKAQAGTRFSLLLIAAFAIIAGVLAGVGLYGVLATTVRHRTAEIGVHMALGAEPIRIFQLVVAQGFRLSVIGVACGLFAAFGLTRLMKAMLVGVQATDPATYAAMVLLFLLIAVLSSWLPARRAAALDPARTLREE